MAALVTHKDSRQSRKAVDVLPSSAGRGKTEIRRAVLDDHRYAVRDFRVHAQYRLVDTTRGKIAVGVDKDDIALLPGPAAGGAIGARTDRNIRFRARRLTACQVERRVQVVRRARHATVLAELTQVRNTHSKNNADDRNRDEEFEKRKAVLVCFVHAGHYKEQAGQVSDYPTNGPWGPTNGGLSDRPFNLIRTGVGFSVASGEGDSRPARITDNERFGRHPATAVANDERPIGCPLKGRSQREGVPIGPDRDVAGDLMAL